MYMRSDQSSRTIKQHSQYIFFFLIFIKICVHKLLSVELYIPPKRKLTSSKYLRMWPYLRIVSLLIKLVKIHLYWSRVDCLIQYHDFGLLTSKTMRQYIFVVLSHPVCDIWLKNPWKKRIRDFGIRKWNATVINTWKYRSSFGIGLWIKAGRNFRCMIEPRLLWRDLVEI